MRILILVLIVSLFACTQTSKTNRVVTDSSTDSNTNAVVPIQKPDTIHSLFSLSGPPDTVKNGEEIKHHKNGQLFMRGMQKNGKRIGVWKSWHQNGNPWSETTFDNGVKTGKTISWFENGKKRYEGFYTNDKESGIWTYWDEKGNLLETTDYGLK